MVVAATIGAGVVWSANGAEVGSIGLQVDEAHLTAMQPLRPGVAAGAPVATADAIPEDGPRARPGFVSVLVHLDPAWVRPVWYFAVVGNFFFFYYRFMITQRRKKAIADFGLIEKIKAGSMLSDDDRDVTVYLLRSIEKSLENYNYLVIFIFSILAIALDIIMSALGG